MSELHIASCVAFTRPEAVPGVIAAIRALEGVIALHLAYQHAEPEESLQEPQC